MFPDKHFLMYVPTTGGREGGDPESSKENDASSNSDYSFEYTVTNPDWYPENDEYANKSGEKDENELESEELRSGALENEEGNILHF